MKNYRKIYYPWTCAYDVEDTAKRLHVSETTVRRYIQQGKIRAKKTYDRTSTICNKDDVAKLIEEQRQRGRI